MDLLFNETRAMDSLINATALPLTNVTSCYEHIHSDHKDPSRCSAFKRFIDIYIVSVLCLVGIIGNVLSIVVLGRDRTMRRTTAFLLQMVAVADGMYLSTCLFFQTANTMTVCTDWLYQLKTIWPRTEPFIWTCASIAQTCTVWLVVVLTADRYFAICKPLHAGFWVTRARIRKVVLLVIIFAFLYNTPRFFEREVVRRISCSNELVYETKRTKLRNNKYYVYIYKTALYFLLRYFLPLSLLAFFNTNLIRAIKRSSELQRKGSSASSLPAHERRQYTLILVVIVLVFVLCGLPDFAMRIAISVCAFLGIQATKVPYLLSINTLSNLCLTINSCINFVIYCLLGRKFRRILMFMCVAETQKRYQPVNQHIMLKHTAVNKARDEHEQAQTTCELLSHCDDNLYN